MRLVPAEGGGRAFVPNSLPEALPYEARTVQLLALAENALGRLEGSLDRLVNPYLVAGPLLRREAILSSRIEGTYTTPKQLVLLEAIGEERAPGGADADTREVLNYIRAMDHGLRRLRELPVCLRLISELHSVLLRGVRGDRERPGEFRTVQNYIGRRVDGIQNARFVPPPPAELEQCLQDFERYLNPQEGMAAQQLPLLIRLALVHYQFEAIHPFRDGNGRLGRLLIPLILCHEQRMRSPTLFVSSYLDKHRDEYVDRMLRVSQRGDWSAWVQFFLQGVVECAQESTQRVAGLLALRDDYHGQFHSARSSALLLKLIDELFGQPSMTIVGAAKVLEVTPASASANIQKLEKAGILKEVTGRKRDRMYIAPGILSFVDDEQPSDEVRH